MPGVCPDVESGEQETDSVNSHHKREEFPVSDS